MATTQKSPELPKPSFAKVAASVSKENTLMAPRRPKSSNNDPPASVNVPLSHSTTDVLPDLTTGTSEAIMPTISTADSQGDIGNITTSLNNVAIVGNVPSLVVDGSSRLHTQRPHLLASRESTSDDSPRADSSSELGTKPPSVDEKSITSGTTFALDEKESLRPDDSASVKALAEDDDNFSVRGSLITGSRMGSEVAARARGIQLGDIPERRSMQQIISSQSHGVLTPQSASSEQAPGVNSATQLSTGEPSDALNVIYRQAPDEKLLDALSSSRDRLFLLRLEKDVIDFVQDSKEPYMDLPPSNSFCRMLTHKLADYYHMTHSYEPHIGSVRIFRTPFCRVPPSLALMVPQPNSSTSSTPPPAVLPKRIMRRGQDDEGGFGSAGASKTTSEYGSDGKDGKDKQPANHKLTREEREEMYKLARERIFGNSEESYPENDSENGISRTSSVSATKGKRGKTSKQRRDDSDSFDSRHQYTPYWGPQQQTWVPQPQAQFVGHVNGQFGAQPPPSFSGQMTPVYNQQAPAYAGMQAMPPSANFPIYSVAQYPPPSVQQRYQPGNSPMAAYSSPIPTQAPPINWQPGYAPTSYPPRAAPQATPQSHHGIPYAYGQLPAHINPHDPKSQHPIPGSYSRSSPAFNPQTQSFVPGGNNMPPVQPPQPPFTAPGSHHSSPQIGTPHLAFTGYQPAIAQPYGGGYGMARQGSNTSIPAYHAPQHHTPPHTQHGPVVQNVQHIPPQHISQHPPPHIPNRPNIPQGPNQIYSHLPTYGNPATLPQKPATGI